MLAGREGRANIYLAKVNQYRTKEPHCDARLGRSAHRQKTPRHKRDLIVTETADRNREKGVEINAYNNVVERRAMKGGRREDQSGDSGAAIVMRSSAMTSNNPEASWVAAFVSTRKKFNASMSRRSSPLHRELRCHDIGAGTDGDRRDPRHCDVVPDVQCRPNPYLPERLTRRERAARAFVRAGDSSWLAE